MDSQLQTLSKIFTESLFRIPDYQRGYAWVEKQLKDFWTDIQQLEQGRNHYTGVLTLEKVPEENYRNWNDDYWIVQAKSYQPFYVVDGQQRLTTAIILIQTILEKIRLNEKLNYTEKADIQRKFIFDSKDDGISRSYIFGYEKDNPSYEYLKTKIFCERSSTSTSQETVYTHNLIQAKDYFSEQITNYSHDQLEILYRKITQDLLFNIFTITEDVDVCVAFETMNNRGKPLSYLELLKNRLIYLSLKFAAADSERNKLRRAINDCWKSIYHNLGRNKDKPLDDDRFLYTHYLVYFGKSNRDDEQSFSQFYSYNRKLFRIDYANDLLENKFISKNVIADAKPDVQISLQDVYKYVSSLQETVETWYKMNNPFFSDFPLSTQIWLDKINRLGMDQFQPLILAFLQRVSSENIQVTFLKAVERNLFINSLFGGQYYRTNPLSQIRIEPLTLQLAIDVYNNELNTDKVIHQINDLSNNSIQYQGFIKIIQDHFRSDGFYEWPEIRYFLFEYNLDLQEHSKTDRPKIFWPEFTENLSDFISVEHIFPQQARHYYWTTRFGGLSQKQKGILRNSLGNLLPLSKPKNSSLSNKPFPEKVNGLDKRFVGYQYGCYAENEVAIIQEWNPQEILTRGIKLLKFMEKRWSIQLGDEEAKKYLLGLDFIH